MVFYTFFSYSSFLTVPGPGDIPYLRKHPRANTDKLSEDERAAMCLAGFNVLKENEQGMVFNYLNDVPTKEIKAYVIVDLISDDMSDTVEVTPAYECPTKPPSYIHVNYDTGDDKPPLYQVIFKIDREIPTFREVLTYQLRLVEKIYPGKTSF